MGEQIMDEPRIVFDPYAGAQPREIVEHILALSNVRRTGHEHWYPVGFFLKTEDGEILGGLLGMIWARWLHIAALAVHEPFRGRGWGSKLLQQAEQYALKRGCTNAWLSTHSFQARPLYERHGYTVFGELPDYPQGHSLFFLTKRLGPTMS
jgi:GNAT superfamily N-acetyltransferase